MRIKEVKILNNNMTEQKQIMIPFFKNTITLGENYIVHLNSDTKNTYIYFLSSKNSVFNVNEKELVTNKLKELCEK